MCKHMEVKREVNAFHAWKLMRKRMEVKRAPRIKSAPWCQSIQEVKMAPRIKSASWCQSIQEVKAKEIKNTHHSSPICRSLKKTLYSQKHLTT